MEEVEEAAKEGMIAMEIEGDTEEVVTTVVAEAETDMMIVEAAGGTLALALVLALVPVQETDTEDTIANHAALEARSNVCYAWQKGGNCKFGDDCRFDHFESDRDGRGDYRGGYHDRDDRGGYRNRDDRGGYRDRDDRGGYRDRDDRGSRFGGDRRERSNVCYAWKDGNCQKSDCRFDHFDDRRGGGDRGEGEATATVAIHEKEALRTNYAVVTGGAVCAKCINLASREECDKCGSKKTDEAVAEVDALIKKNEDEGLPENFRPGDWMCPACKGHIYSRHETCTKCDNTTMKPSDGGSWGVLMEPTAAPVTEGAAPLDNEDSNNAAQGSVVAADEEPVVAEAS